MSYKISSRALVDIKNIWLYTFETWSLQQADRYYNLIFDEIEYLAENPLSGKDFQHIRKHYRYSLVKSHLIFYKYKKDPDFIEIVRVLHQSMNIDGLVF